MLRLATPIKPSQDIQTETKSSENYLCYDIIHVCSFQDYSQSPASHVPECPSQSVSLESISRYHIDEYSFFRTSIPCLKRLNVTIVKAKPQGKTKTNDIISIVVLFDIIPYKSYNETKKQQCV